MSIPTLTMIFIVAIALGIIALPNFITVRNVIAVILIVVFTPMTYANEWVQECTPDGFGGQTCIEECRGFGPNCGFSSPRYRTECRPDGFGGYSCTRRCEGFNCP